MKLKMNNRFIKKIPLILVLLAVIVSCSEKNRPSNIAIQNERFESIKDSILKKVDKGDIPSLSVAVFENGKITWMESFGFADKENKIKATPTTLYGIASISKPITATGVMKLYEDEKIDLDSDIKNYLKDLNLKYYVDDSIRVNCRNLLSHTAGLPMHFQYYYGNDIALIPNVKEVVSKYGIIVNKPTSKYEYANLGYGILGEVIAQSSGVNFNEYMTQEIFNPLGMTQTSLDVSSKTLNKLAKRYDLNGKLIPYSFSDTPGAGNVSTTIKDLILFGKFHLSMESESKETILNENTIQSMQQRQYDDNINGRNTYGLGWFIDDSNYKYKMVYHAGGMDGIDAMIRLIPEKNIAVAAISNRYSEYTHQVTEDILLEMIPDLKTINEKQSKNETPAIRNKTKKVMQSDLIGSWTGHIVTDKKQIPIELVFQEDGDIHVKMPIQFDSMLLFTNKYKIQHKMLLNKWFFNNGHFMGWYAGDIPGDHLLKCPQTTLLNLKYQYDKLVGTAVALASNPSIMHYALSHYLELEKNSNK